MALWSDFLQTSRVNLYCAGGAANPDGRIFHQIRGSMGPPDVAVLPIGNYAPRWFMGTQDLKPEETIQIALAPWRKAGVGHPLGNI